MPSGSRPGEHRGGRKKGTPNKKTIEAAKKAAEVGRVLAEQLGENCFAGDAHALAIAIYKDVRNPPELRLEAAKAAMPYEKPRLSAVEHSGSIGTSHEERLFERLKAEEAAKVRKHDA